MTLPMSPANSPARCRQSHRVFPSSGLLALTGMLAAASIAAAQPTNNICASAIPIGNGTISGTTAGGSTDGSANCGSSNTSPDVWYRYTATATTTVTAHTCNAGASYDTVLSVHTTCPGVPGGQQLACNDDSTCEFGGLRSRVTFQTVMGTDYYIRVGGFGGSSGAFVLSVGPGGGVQPPVNDACASATAIGNGSFTGTTSGATDDGDSSCPGSAGGDVYYLYTAPQTGPVVASTCPGASFDTVISVHSACPADVSNQIACNDNFCSSRSQVQFAAVAGMQYLIRITGSTTAGTFTLSTGDPPPPGSNGPDVTYQELTDVSNYGAVGGIRAYALGSATCNIGDEDLLWLNDGTPALAMNAYRLSDGRLTQLGLGFCKTACCAAAGAGCGTCNGRGGAVLGAGCRDVYSAGFNGGQAALAPRSVINAYTGEIGSFPGNGGDLIFRRLQVRQTDLSTAGAQYFVEGQYIASDDAQANNDLNNVSYKRVTVTPATFAMTGAGNMNIGIPAIRAWRDHGLGANTPDTRVNIVAVNVPDEGRFWVASKVTQLAENRYLYDYAVFNLNSDRSAGALSVRRGAGVSITGVGFHDVDYHSGEPYDNTDWTSAVADGSINWRSPQTFAQNQNSNALRWGTMYNFWFEANSPPTSGPVTLTLFKPHTPQEVVFEGPRPTPICTADWDDSGIVESQDFFDLLEDFFNGQADFNRVGGTDSQDYFDFLEAFLSACP